MKMLPHIYWDYVREISMRDSLPQIEQHTRMTHNNSVSVVASVLHYQIARSLLRGHTAPEDVPKMALHQVLLLEQLYPDAENLMSKTLGKLAALREVTPDAIVALAPRGGFIVSETLLMAYGAFAIDSSFKGSVTTAVNLGGDADSIASITAGMAVLHNPEVDWPDDIGDVVNIEHFRDVSRRLADAALK